MSNPEEFGAVLVLGSTFLAAGLIVWARGKVTQWRRGKSDASNPHRD